MKVGGRGNMRDTGKRQSGAGGRARPGGARGRVCAPELAAEVADGSGGGASRGPGPSWAGLRRYSLASTGGGYRQSAVLREVVAAEIFREECHTDKPWSGRRSGLTGTLSDQPAATVARRSRRVGPAHCLDRGAVLGAAEVVQLVLLASLLCRCPGEAHVLSDSFEEIADVQAGIAQAACEREWRAARQSHSRLRL